MPSTAIGFALARGPLDIFVVFGARSAGRAIGAQPQRLAANSVATNAIPARNHGCWN
jgi:hypothetical protein